MADEGDYLSGFGKVSKGWFGAVEGYAHYQGHVAGVTGYSGVGRGLLGASIGTAVAVGFVETTVAYNENGVVAATTQAVASSGGIVGAVYGGKIGATAGTPFGPIGAAVLGAAGSVAGALMGDKAVKDMVDVFTQPGPALTPEQLDIMHKHVVWRRAITQPEQYAANPDLYGPQCFPAGTIIQLEAGVDCVVEGVVVDQQVSSFDEHAKLNSPIKTSRVTRLFENVADEFIELTFIDPETGDQKRITSTPGHVYLTANGQWQRLCDMLETPIVREGNVVEASFGGEEQHGANAVMQPSAELQPHARYSGHTQIVLADGAIAEASAWAVQYSAATAGCCAGLVV